MPACHHKHDHVELKGREITVKDSGNQRGRGGVRLTLHGPVHKITKESVMQLEERGRKTVLLSGTELH